MPKFEFFTFTLQNAPNVPEWMRSLGRDDTGEIYAPGDAFIKNETQLMLCAVHDGVTTVDFDGHLFVPLTWIEPVCTSDEHKTLIGNMRRHMAAIA